MTLGRLSGIRERREFGVRHTNIYPETTELDDGVINISFNKSDI